MIGYCSDQTERSYKFFEDQDHGNGIENLAHIADVLLLLKECRNTNGEINITSFVLETQDFNDLWKDQLWSFLQENGFGQYIPE
jgi:hypothetical protein